MGFRVFQDNGGERRFHDLKLNEYRPLLAIRGGLFAFGTGLALYVLIINNKQGGGKMQVEKTDERIIRKPELLRMLQVSDPSIFRWERAGKFPRRIRLGGQACGWLASEIEGWLREKAAARGAK